MAKQKKEVHKVQMTEGKRAIIQQLFQEYDIESANDIQDALKDLLGGTIKEMLETEMDGHLGYSKSERSDSENARNGYKSKILNSSYGHFKSMFLKALSPLSSPRLSRNARRISRISTRRSFPCMPRE